MNVAYIYLQLYRLFDEVTPIRADCGNACRSACCKGEGGMYLFPGEQKVYELLNPDWIRIEKSELTYEFEGREKSVPIAFCSGECDRYQRPLACRIFPLTPYIDESGKLHIIVDPRGKSICPLANGLHTDDFDYKFVKNVKKAFRLLSKNKQVYAFLKEYSECLREFMQFY